MATYYWVGGTGTWSDTGNTNFAITSGGVATLLDPTAADIVIFDSNSGAGICTTASGATASTVTLNTATLSLTLGANLSIASSFTLTLGALDLNNNVLTSTTFSSNNTNTRSIAFGTGNITLTGNAATIWTTQNATGFSYTGTSKVIATYSGSTGTRDLFHASISGGTEANTPSFYITAGTDIVGIFDAKTIDLTGFSGTLKNSARNIYGDFIIAASVTLLASASINIFRATSGAQKITTNGKTLDFPITQNGVGGTVQLQDNLTIGSTRTYTLTNGALDLNNQTLSTGLFNSTNSNVRSIAFGTGNITLTGNNTTVWTTSTIANFSYTGTPTVNFTYAGAVGTRQITTGNGTEAQVLNYNITAGTDGVGFISAVGSLDFTGFGGTYSQSTTQLVAYRNVTFSAGMTITGGTGILYFYSVSSTQNLTTNGKTINCPIIVGDTTQAPTLVCQDALTQNSTRAFTVTNGTVQLKNGVTSTVGAFATSGTKPKFLQSTTPGLQATLSQASGTVNASYLTIRDINATGGATWNARTDLGSKDITNNTGWNFIFIAVQQILKPIMAKILKPIILN